MPSPPFSAGFGPARFVAALALDRERLQRFLRSPRDEAAKAGLDEEEQELIIQYDVMHLFYRIELAYWQEFGGIKPLPVEQPGDGRRRH